MLHPKVLPKGAKVCRRADVLVVCFIKAPTLKYCACVEKNGPRLFSGLGRVREEFP